MADRNVEVVKALQPSGIDLVAAVGGEQDEQPFPDIQTSPFAEDVEAVFVRPAVYGERNTYRGLAGLVAGWRDWLEAWERYEIEAEEFIPAGDKVVVLVRVRGRVRRGGIEMEHAPAAVWTLRDGLVRRIEFYLDRDEALAAAGSAARARDTTTRARRA